MPDEESTDVTELSDGEICSQWGLFTFLTD